MLYAEFRMDPIIFAGSFLMLILIVKEHQYAHSPDV